MLGSAYLLGTLASPPLFIALTHSPRVYRHPYVLRNLSSYHYLSLFQISEYLVTYLELLELVLLILELISVFDRDMSMIRHIVQLLRATACNMAISSCSVRRRHRFSHSRGGKFVQCQVLSLCGDR